MMEVSKKDREEILREINARLERRGDSPATESEVNYEARSKGDLRYCYGEVQRGGVPVYSMHIADQGRGQ